MTKNRLLFQLILLALPLAVAAQSANQTFSKSFNTSGKDQVTIDLPGTIDLRIWNNPTIRVEISVSLASGNSAMLSELATVGRYNLVAKPNATGLLMQAPNLQKQVRVKGVEIKENVSFVVFVPKEMSVLMPNSGTAGVDKK
jgi:hypothetical protein